MLKIEGGLSQSWVNDTVEGTKTGKALSVTEAQIKLIASNANSLAWADMNPKRVPMEIYGDGEPVGFVMYESRGNEVQPINRRVTIRHEPIKGYSRLTGEKRYVPQQLATHQN